MRAEDRLQIQICDYIKLAYPQVIFTSEAAGGTMSMGMAMRAKRMRSGNKLPDLLIFEARAQYHGLLIELKVKSPYLKDGKTLSGDKHIQEQNKMVNALISRGYRATFAWSFDMAKGIIDSYLK